MAYDPNDSSTRESMEEAYTHLKEAGNSMKNAAHSVSGDAQRAAQEQYNRGRQGAEAVAMEAEGRIKERPLAAVGIAFAAGWLLSRLMR